MKTVDPTAAPSREFGRFPEDIEQTLRSFFQQEMPKPWPAFAGERVPAAHQPQIFRANSRRPLLRSRLVLAASLLLILVGAWLLGGRFATPESSNSPSGQGRMIGTKERRAAPGKIAPADKPAKDSTSHLHP